MSEKLRDAEVLQAIRARTDAKLRDAQGFAESGPLREEMAALDTAIAILASPQEAGEAVAWQIRRRLFRPDGTWSGWTKWEFVPKETYEAEQGGRRVQAGSFECRALYTTPPAPTADQFCDGNCVWTDHHPDCQFHPDKIHTTPSHGAWPTEAKHAGMGDWHLGGLTDEEVEAAKEADTYEADAVRAGLAGALSHQQPASGENNG